MAQSKKRKTKNGKTVVPKTSVLATDTGVNQDVSQQEELKQDFLDDFLFQAANYIYVKRKLFITIGIVSVFILLSVYGGYRFIEYRDNMRNEELYSIERVLNDSGLKETQRFEKAVVLLDMLIKEHPDTKQFNLALLYRGNLYAKQKKYLQAEMDLKQVMSDLESSSDLYIVASLYLANILRDQNKDKQAIDVLQKAKTEKLTDFILMELSEVYYTTQQKDKAKQTLEVLIKDYPTSTHKRRAEQLLKLL